MLKNRNDLFEALGIRKQDTLCLVLKSYGVEYAQLTMGSVHLSNSKGETQHFTFPFELIELTRYINTCRLEMIQIILDKSELFDRDYRIKCVFYMNEEEVKVSLTFFPENITKDAIINFINKEVTNYE